MNKMTLKFVAFLIFLFAFKSFAQPCVVNSITIKAQDNPFVLHFLENSAGDCLINADDLKEAIKSGFTLAEFQIALRREGIKNLENFKTISYLFHKKDS
jgi:hypothetical protein